jgi:hypothetical protein
VQRARRVQAACGPPLSSPFDEHSRGNHEAIMIRVLSHRWHSAGEESDRYSVRSSRAARATACAAQAQERERRCVSTPSRHSRGGERHAREGDQPPRAEHRVRVERQRAPPEYVSESSSVYRCQANAAAATSVTPARAIICARAEQRVEYCAQAREREQLLVSTPNRRRAMVARRPRG